MDVPITLSNKHTLPHTRANAAAEGREVRANAAAEGREVEEEEEDLFIFNDTIEGPIKPGRITHARWESVQRSRPLGLLGGSHGL